MTAIIVVVSDELPHVAEDVDGVLEPAGPLVAQRPAAKRAGDAHVLDEAQKRALRALEEVDQLFLLLLFGEISDSHGLRIDGEKVVSAEPDEIAEESFKRHVDVWH